MASQHHGWCSYEHLFLQCEQLWLQSGQKGKELPVWVPVTVNISQI